MASDRDDDNGGEMILGSGVGNAGARRTGVKEKIRAKRKRVRRLGCFFQELTLFRCLH